MDPDDPEIQVIRLAYAAGVRFLLIGRQACILYGLPVLSFDYDLWVWPNRENLAHLVAVARTLDLTPSVPLDRVGETGFFRLENDRHIDVHKVAFFATPEGHRVTFDEAWGRRVEMRDDSADLVIPVPAVEDLIITKLAAGRKKDIEDAKALRVVLELRRTTPAS